MEQQIKTYSLPMRTLLKDIKQKLGEDTKLYHMFEYCFTNTLHKTVKLLEDKTTYVITGDIPAMWLRDSVCQLRPYLILAKEDYDLKQLLEGLVERQFQYINLDPYANAFNESPNGNCWEEDDTKRNPWIWERKYEIDSLCFPLQFSYLLWKQTGSINHFNQTFLKGAYKIIETWKVEQNHEEQSPYSFSRKNTYFTDTLSRNGKGALTKGNIGMTWSGFRPSDDACQYGYLIPSNMFAVVVLSYLEEIAAEIFQDNILAAEANKLKSQLYESIETIGITKTEAFGAIYSYETDGFGAYNLMDDANIPSLLSMSYFGYKGKSELVEKQTKAFILSDYNPYYYKGIYAKGIGSPHTPANYIWHISLAIQGLTSHSKEEKKRYLDLLKDTDANTNCMHEGFHVDNPNQYTREWFSWANAMFSELVLDYCGYSIVK